MLSIYQLGSYYLSVIYILLYKIVTVVSVYLFTRDITEEWKGWMQVMFVWYHYFAAVEWYNWIRVYIAAYVWMTGFGVYAALSLSLSLTLCVYLCVCVCVCMCVCVNYTELSNNRSHHPHTQGTLLLNNMILIIIIIISRDIAPDIIFCLVFSFLIFVVKSHFV